MSQRVERTRSGDGEFEIERVEGGKRTIFRTDDEGEFIYHQIARLVEDFELTGQLKFKVEPQGDRWFRVEISYPPGLDPETWVDIGTDFRAAFSGGKGWYECREEGGNQDGSVEWYVCRHRNGPWL